MVIEFIELMAKAILISALNTIIPGGLLAFVFIGFEIHNIALYIIIVLAIFSFWFWFLYLEDIVETHQDLMHEIKRKKEYKAKHPFKYNDRVFYGVYYSDPKCGINLRESLGRIGASLYEYKLDSLQSCIPVVQNCVDAIECNIGKYNELMRPADVFCSFRNKDEIGVILQEIKSTNTQLALSIQEFDSEIQKMVKTISSSTPSYEINIGGNAEIVELKKCVGHVQQAIANLRLSGDMIKPVEAKKND